MSATPKAVTRLIDAFSRLPGIGPKTASRLTYYLLRGGKEEAQALQSALGELYSGITLCSNCYNISESDPCALCSDLSRDQDLICVVEEPLDVLAIEHTGCFRGLYHVLHGHISPMDRIGPDQLKLRELAERVQRGTVHEVIVATNPTLEGDATALYVLRQLADSGVSVSRLALGLPRGGDLEYADRVTLSEALLGRREMQP
ncbi:MAG: recombination protein RecR [Chloroflexi bacterium]|nr:recombination protein RecR [Chloroflexota bacterium]